MITSLVGGMCLIIAPLFFWAALRRDENLKPFALPTLAMGILANVPSVVFWSSEVIGFSIKPIEGVILRMGLLVALFWIFVFAAWCMRKSG